jgi:MerR family redox-sensitive transcriptional activator SoxR
MAWLQSSTSINIEVKCYPRPVPRTRTAFDALSVGQVAERSGVAVSALHFYERHGLITSERTAGNQRRYARHTLRRVAFIRASHHVGISLADIRAALAQLPHGRTPTPADWARVSTAWRGELDDRIAELEALRDNLDGCIACGCLSLKTCQLANPRDILGREGPGARRLGRRQRSAAVSIRPTA